ncbi:hypothetical protein HYALB_00008802 [Hymenoscyphus albidus]|uniref:Low temperature requirement a protein n=1 Tax=Hymenoscyphus albidus TaxID=595503 RepID=A0A9N9LZS7_9HELO|nr:hypothetical protein HYALB_00008802 [Hymenoscyphus albidus]
MSTTPTTLSGTTTGTHHQHNHRSRRMKNFVLPDGREVHIAISPEEAETLRQRLAAVRSKDEPFDLVISGSPEHLEALRQAHSHHESRREALKTKHGDDYDEFENVRSELDALGSELHMLTDHSVSLDANFSKYGYSAHLRTYDDGSTPGNSASSVDGFHDSDHEKRDWEKEKSNGRIMKIYRKPVVRQYFHKGLLWRASETTEVASFELFVDLLYVGILAINGDHASEEPNGQELLRFAITFIMSWKIWNDLQLIVSWFETDDILQRVSVIFIMACLLGLTTQMLEAFGETWSMLVAFYLAARLFMGSYYLIVMKTIPMIRGMMVAQVVATIIPCVLWIASIYVEYPNRLALIWIAIALDLAGGVLPIIFIRIAKHINAGLGEWMEQVFEFYPATNIEHKVERTNAFVTLVFGYSVVAVIYQSVAPFGLNAFYGKAVLGLIQAFCFNWIYFELDGADLFAHAIRRNATAAMLWSTAHLPFIMAYTLGAAALSRLVMAHDCPDAEPHNLTHFYEEKSEAHIPLGLRLFYCIGLGLALALMGLFSLTHVHKEGQRGIRIRKAYRLANRFAVCIIIFCLPAAEHLNSLQLISIVTGLVVYVLLIELWGASCPEDSWFGEKGKGRCRYTAFLKISRRDLENVKHGGRIKVEELRETGE